MLLSHQFSSAAQSCPTLWDSVNWSTPGLPALHHLPEFAQTHAHWVGDAIQPSHPLFTPFSSCLQSLPASGSFPVSRLFTSVGQSTGTSASACSSNEYSRLIFFKIEWFHLLTVQGTLKSFLQHHSLKGPVLWHSVFFMVQLLHLYLITGKTIALRIQTYVGKLPISLES